MQVFDRRVPPQLPAESEATNLELRTIAERSALRRLVEATLMTVIAAIPLGLLGVYLTAGIGLRYGGANLGALGGGSPYQESDSFAVVPLTIIWMVISGVLAVVFLRSYRPKV